MSYAVSPFYLHAHTMRLGTIKRRENNRVASFCLTDWTSFRSNRLFEHAISQREGEDYNKSPGIRSHNLQVNLIMFLHIEYSVGNLAVQVLISFRAFRFLFCSD